MARGGVTAGTGADQGALEELQRTWDRLGAEDPLWAVLSYPERRGGRWDLEEFLATGRREIEALLARIEALGLDIGRRRALDFGCGVGRLTQALAAHFERCDGVDIAPSMIDHARRLNRFKERCHYHVNLRDDLSLFADGSFDLVYSRLVLVHVPPELSRRYVAELIRVTRPNGLAVFHLPSGPATTATTYAMPPGAYRAALAVRLPRRRLHGGETLSCEVRVVNCGTDTWPVQPAHGSGIGWVRVGNHWRDWRGRLAVTDDGRTVLPHDLGPGAAATVSLGVTAPRRRGPWLLEVDVVHEGICWFADRGSVPARAVVWVGGATSAAQTAVAVAPATTPAEGPRFGMYAVPRDHVLAVVTAAGGRVVATDEEDVGAFHDVLYYVTRFG